MAIRFKTTEGKKVVAVDCMICGYPNVVKIDKYGRYLTKCPKCGLMCFYRGPLATEWLESRFKAIELEGVII